MKYYLFQLYQGTGAVSSIWVFNTQEERDSAFAAKTQGNTYLEMQYGTVEGETWEDCFRVDQDNRVQTL